MEAELDAEIIDFSSRAELAGARVAEEEAARTRDALRSELRRARRRIAQLERNLLTAMRDSLENYQRAEAAERRLEDRSR